MACRLRAALAAGPVRDNTPELRLVHKWLDSWSGLGLVVAGMTKIRYLVEAAGGTMNDIVRQLIFVTDISRRDEIIRARREFFTGDFPVSTQVEVSALVMPGLLVEIEVRRLSGHRARRDDPARDLLPDGVWRWHRRVVTEDGEPAKGRTRPS